MHKFTKEENDFIKQIYKGKGWQDIADEANKEFNINLNASQIGSFLRRNKLNTGRSGRFQPGGTPWNKDKKGISIGGEQTYFRKGHKPHNSKDVGSERVNSDGYIYVKVAQPNDWKAKHRLVYEKYYGQIPKDHIIIFSDGDRMNTNIDNLILISRGDSVLLNKHGYVNGDSATIEAGLNLVRLNRKIYDLDVKGNQYEEYQSIAENKGINKNAFNARLRKGWTYKEAAYVPKFSHRKKLSAISREGGK